MILSARIKEHDEEKDDAYQTKDAIKEQHTKDEFGAANASDFIRPANPAGFDPLRMPTCQRQYANAASALESTHGIASGRTFIA
jgi:hypothetical protein